MTSTLDSNLHALRASGYPVPQQPRVPLDWELDASGPEMQLRVPGPGGPLIAVHSRRNPRAEAEQLIADAGLTAAHSVALLAGAGLGFAIEALAERRADLPVIVTDATFNRLVPFLCRRDWSESIAKGRLGLFWPDAATQSRGLRRMIEARDDDDALIVLPHPVLARRDSPELGAIVAAFRRTWQGARANRAARLAFEGPYADNTLANLSRLDGMFDLRRMAGRESGRPAVVVAAGPSLDNQIQDILHVREAVTLIAVDTALRPLLGAGLDPDFVVAVDPSALNATHLIDVAAQTRARLVSELSLPPTVFDAFAWRAAPFRVGLNEPWPWLVAQGVDLAILAAWGSVLVTAIDAACHLGCDPVLICGADLAYTGGRPYCRGTTFGRNAAENGETEDQLAARWMRLVDERLVTLDDIHGGPTRLPAHFPTVRDAIVDLAARRHDRRIVNTTGAGILAGGRIIQGTLRGSLASDGKSAGRSSGAIRDARLSTGLRAGRHEGDASWHQLVQSVGAAWPDANESATAGLVAVLRSLALAESRAEKGLPIPADACVRWMAPFIDAPWTGEVLRVVQALNTALPRWFEHLEPLVAQAIAEGQAAPGTYAHLALWLSRTAGDALFVSPVSALIRRAADRLFEMHRSGDLPPETQADLASLAVSGGGRAAEVGPLVTTAARQLPDRPVVSEVLVALSLRARADALHAAAARVAPEALNLARPWADLDIGAGRDTATTYRQLVHLAACSGQVMTAERILRDGVSRHAALVDSSAVLALESWFSGEEAFARMLLESGGLPAAAAPAPPLLFQLATAHALVGDPRCACELFTRLHATAPWFFALTATPNNRWFYLARAAAALGDSTLASRARQTAERWDPFARQREAVAPAAAPAPGVATSTPGAGEDAGAGRLPRFELPADTKSG